MSENIIFIGGPGRSGTSFVADRIGQHPEVATFTDVELKIFHEFGGLLDLRAVLVENYSPNRGQVALNRFNSMVDAVINGGYGQPSLANVAPEKAIRQAFKAFQLRLTAADFPIPVTYSVFNESARALIADLANTARGAKESAKWFLEKTPHNLLQPQFLHEVAPTARYLHVYRNPKGIAASLLNQKWGPSTLDQAIVWVRAYFDAWSKSREVFARFGLPLMDVRIEDISGATQEMSARVSTFLGLNAEGDVFAGANADTLDRWKSKLTSQQIAALDEALGGLCASLGY